jgi:hypothetical protein
MCKVSLHYFIKRPKVFTEGLQKKVLKEQVPGSCEDQDRLVVIGSENEILQCNMLKKL